MPSIEWENDSGMLKGVLSFYLGIKRRIPGFIFYWVLVIVFEAGNEFRVAFCTLRTRCFAGLLSQTFPNQSTVATPVNLLEQSRMCFSKDRLIFFLFLAEQQQQQWVSRRWQAMPDLVW